MIRRRADQRDGFRPEEIIRQGAVRHGRDRMAWPCSRVRPPRHHSSWRPQADLSIPDNHALPNLGTAISETRFFLFWKAFQIAERVSDVARRYLRARLCSSLAAAIRGDKKRWIWDGRTTDSRARLRSSPARARAATAIGNGRAIAVVLARHGAKVVLVDMEADWAKETEKLISQEGGASIIVEADVSDAAACQAVVGKAMSTWGPARHSGQQCRHHRTARQCGRGRHGSLGTGDACQSTYRRWC